MAELFTFTVSHFSEKARWGLELGGVRFDEKRLLPGPHMLTTRRLAKHSWVPIYRDGATVVQGSTAILDHAVEKLGATKLAPPAGEEARAKELEALADHAFGLGVQRVGYDSLLAYPKEMKELWAQDGPAWGKAFYGVTFSFMARTIRKLYKISPARVAKAKEDFVAAFDVFDAQLGDKPYLFGDAPTRVDVALSALLGPLATPKEHLVKWPRLPDDLAAFAAPLRDRPTFRHVLSMYAKHRNRPS